MKLPTSPEADEPVPDLYELLGVERGADTASIEAAYRKKCLGCHPDRMHGKTEEEKELADEQFELLTLAQTVLTDDGKRRLYDKQGLIDVGPTESGMNAAAEELSGEQADEWLAKYRGSEEEVDEVCMHYDETGGDFNVIMNSIPGTTVKGDEARLKAIVERMFSEDELDPTPLWKKTSSESASKKRLEKEEAVEKEHADAKRTGKVRTGVSEDDLQDFVANIKSSLLNPETLAEICKKGDMGAKEEGELIAALSMAKERGVKRPRDEAEGDEEEEDEEDEESESEPEPVARPVGKRQKKDLRSLLRKSAKKM